MAEQQLDHFYTRFSARTDRASIDRTRNFFRGLRQSLNRLGIAAGVAGGLLTAATTGFIKQFGALETQYAKIEGLVGIQASTIRDQFAPAIQQLAGDLGIIPQKLAEGMFYVTSAGQRGKEAIDTLTISARAQVAQLGEVNVIADLLTSVMAAYGSENMSAAKAADELAMGIRLGKLEAASLAPVLGNVLPVAAKLGVEFHEIVGLMAAGSRTSGAAAAPVLATQLNSIMSDLMKASDGAKKVIQEELNMSMEELRDVIAKDGLLTALKMMDDAFGDNIEAMNTVFDNVRALRSALDLLGENADTTIEIMLGMESATGALNEAYEAQSKTITFELNRAQAAAQLGMVTLGAAMAPVAGMILDRLIPALLDAVEWFQALPPSVQNLTGGLVLLGLALSAIAVAAPIVGFVLEGVAVVLGLIGLPLVGVLAGLAALAFGAYYLWGPQIRDAWASVQEVFLDPVIAAIKQEWQGETWAAIQTAWNNRSLEPILAYVRAFWDSDAWETIKTTWDSLLLVAKAALVSPIFDEAGWLNVEGSWQSKWLQPLLAGVVAVFDGSAWDGVVAWWEGLWLAPIVAAVVAWADELSWGDVVAWWEGLWLAPIVAAVVAWADELSWDDVVAWWERSWLGEKVAAVVAWADELSWGDVVAWWEGLWLAPIVAAVVAWADELSWDDVVAWWERSWLGEKVGVVVAKARETSWDDVVAWWEGLWLAPIVAAVVAWADELSWDDVVAWWERSWLGEKVGVVVAKARETSWDDVVAWWEGLWLAPIVAAVVAWADELSWDDVVAWWEGLWLAPIVAAVVAWADELSWGDVVAWWEGLWLAPIVAAVVAWADELSWDDVVAWWERSWLGEKVGVVVAKARETSWDDVVAWWERSWLGEKVGVVVAKARETSWGDVVAWWERSWLGEKVGVVVAKARETSWDDVVAWWERSWLAPIVGAVVAWFDELSWDDVVAAWDLLSLSPIIGTVRAVIEQAEDMDVAAWWEGLRTSLAPISTEIAIAGLDTVSTFWESLTETLDQENYSENLNKLAAALLSLGMSLGELIAVVVPGAVELVKPLLVAIADFAGQEIAKTLNATVEVLTALVNVLAWFVDHAAAAAQGIREITGAINESEPAGPGAPSASGARRFGNAIARADARHTAYEQELLEDGFLSTWDHTKAAGAALWYTGQEIAREIGAGSNRPPSFAEQQAAAMSDGDGGATWWNPLTWKLPEGHEGGITGGTREFPMMVNPGELITPLDQLDRVIASVLNLPRLDTAFVGAGQGGDTYHLSAELNFTYSGEDEGKGRRLLEYGSSQLRQQLRELAEELNTPVVR